MHVALAKGNMLCVAELLEWLWRAKGQVPSAQCPTPHAQCPTPHAQCPTPYAQCPMPNAQCPMPNAQRPTPHAQCPMPNAQFQVGREALVAETLEPVLAFTKLCEVWLSGKQVVPNCTNAPMHQCTNAPPNAPMQYALMRGGPQLYQCSRACVRRPACSD